MIQTMNNSQTNKPNQPTFLYRLGGYYGIPHELIHILAYRIIRKPYSYQWGDYQVISLAYETETQREKLFITLLPFATFMGFGLFFHFLWVISAFFIKIRPEQYFIDGPTWHFSFFIVGSLFIAYASTAHYDLIKAYCLLFRKNKLQYDSPKPHRNSNDKKQQGKHPQTSNGRML